MSWRAHLQGWLIARGGQARQQVHRVSEQAVARARQAGRVVAARVLAVQRAAGLPDKLIRRSVQSVATREPSRPSDAAWRDGYLQVADRREPALAAPVLRDLAGVTRPEGPRFDREAGQ